MAGPVTLTAAAIGADDIEATALLGEQVAAVIPAAHVMLRVPSPNRIVVTLVRLRDVVATLPSGTYRGQIRLRSSGAVLADLVNVHERQSSGLQIVVSGVG